MFGVVDYFLDRSLVLLDFFVLYIFFLSPLVGGFCISVNESQCDLIDGFNNNGRFVCFLLILFYIQYIDLFLCFFWPVAFFAYHVFCSLSLNFWSDFSLFLEVWTSFKKSFSRPFGFRDFKDVIFYYFFAHLYLLSFFVMTGLSIINHEILYSDFCAPHQWTIFCGCSFSYLFFLRLKLWQLWDSFSWSNIKVEVVTNE